MMLHSRDNAGKTVMNNSDQREGRLRCHSRQRTGLPSSDGLSRGNFP